MTDRALSIESLSIRLGNRPVLSQISFELPTGAFLAILGPNGSGKSTLVRGMLGLITPHKGRILIHGTEASATPAGTVGYIPQIKSLDRSFPGRADELIASAVLGRWPHRLSSALRSKVESALQRVGAEHLSSRPIGALSGGELQRVYLARALVQTSPLLVLDEPEAGIDAAGTADLQHQLETYRNTTGATIVLVTHDWDVALHHATHALLLRNRQIAFGPPRIALTEACIRDAFGHVGHAHAMVANTHG